MSKLDDAVKLLNDDMGAGSLMFMSDPSLAVDRIPSGNLSLDLALGGGWPKRTIVELFGPEGSGKSSIASLLVAQAQLLGERCAYLDVENGLSPAMAASAGADVDKLIYGQPGSLEETMTVTETLLKTGELGVIVIDSVAAMSPLAEINGDLGDSHVGLVGRLMSQSMRRLGNIINDRSVKTDTIIVFVNQIRETIGKMGYGPATVTPGGKALKFWSGVRLDVRKIEQIKPKATEDPIGHVVKIKTVKNRSAPPLKTADLEMYYDRGISNSAAILDSGKVTGDIKLSGSWYSVPSTGEKLGQGKIAAMDYLDADPTLAAELEKEIRGAA